MWLDSEMPLAIRTNQAKWILKYKQFPASIN